jgi:protein TonB
MIGALTIACLRKRQGGTMLGTLLESNAPRQRRRASTMASIAIHTAVIVSAIVATASAKPEPRRAERRWENPPVYVPIREGDRRSREASPTRRPTSALWSEDMRPPDKLILTYVPNPPSNLLTDIDPATLLGADTLAPGGPRGPIGGELVGPPLGDRPATAATVDRAAALLAPPRPRYPDQLRAAGVTGRVIVRLVVDTTGRVEPASVVIRESSHDLFAQAVRAVLPGLRFAPAEAGGRRVRMLVDLPFEFRLEE